MFKWLACMVLIVRVTIPLGIKQTYEAERVTPDGFYYLIRLTNGKSLYVPIMFTVIEEK